MPALVPFVGAFLPYGLGANQDRYSTNVVYSTHAAPPFIVTLSGPTEATCEYCASRQRRADDGRCLNCGAPLP